MKQLPFRVKLFLVSLLLVMVGTDMLGLIFLNQIQTLMIARETQAASLEAAVTVSHIANDLNDALIWNSEMSPQVYQSTLRYYQQFYADQGVTLSLKQTQSFHTISIQEEMLYICQPLPEPFNLWELNYRRDLSPCFAVLKRCMKYFCRTSLAIMLCMIAALAFFTERVTRPLSELLCATRKISHGEYDITLSMQCGDELGELASHFSAMSRAIKKQFEETRQLALDKQRLVDQLAHELRTPLTSICGFSELLLCGSCTEEERMTALNHVHQQAVRMRALSLRLLEQEKITPQTLCREWIPFKDFLQELKAAWSGIESRTGVLVKDSQDEGWLYGDRLWLQNMVLNLIENAAQASVSGDIISVKMRAVNGGAYIEVCDRGCGISAEDIPHIFEPFFRANRMKARTEGGNGLGLSLCRTIVQAHEGRIEVQSILGRGSKFFIFLPDGNNLPTTS